MLDALTHQARNRALDRAVRADAQTLARVLLLPNATPATDHVVRARPL